MKTTALFLLSALALSSISVGAKTLRETDPNVYNYDVLFTNPTCTAKQYGFGVETTSGGTVYEKPANVFCTRGDKKVTAARDGSDNRMGYNESPQYRLLNLINDSETKHIFMTYLSFSDSTVARGLCARMKNDGMKLDLVLDRKNEQGSIDRSLQRYLQEGETLKGEARKRAEKALEKAKNSKNSRVVKLRAITNPTRDDLKKLGKAEKDYEKLLTKSQYLGSVICVANGDQAPNANYKVKRMAKPKGIGWSHTKVFMVNPQDKKKITLSFASANMSSGTTIHHENWHFVTASANSHFMKSHLCLMNGEFDHAGSREEFKKYMKSCRKNIKGANGKKLYAESDIKTFASSVEFVGNRGLRQLPKYMI